MYVFHEFYFISLGGVMRCSNACSKCLWMDGWHAVTMTRGLNIPSCGSKCLYERVANLVPLH